MSKKLNLAEFLNYYRKFISVPTWTKVKHDFHYKLMNYLHKVEHVTIDSNYNSKTVKVKRVNHFTIFKVADTQRGNMKPYRGKWVMMYCSGRNQYKRYLLVFPLNNDFDTNQSKTLLKEFKLSYDEIEPEVVNS
jgi:hypothetical protein